MLDQLKEKISSQVTADVILGPLTTYKIGGPADYFFAAKSTEEAVQAVRVATELGLPFYILGGGSNVLIGDEGFRGLVVHLVSSNILIEKDIVLADAGTAIGAVARQTVEAGLTGFEWAIGLPGTIGGAARGNAGMWGSEMKDVVASIWAMKDGEERSVSLEECSFSYRDSIFKREPGWLILKVALQLKATADKSVSQKLMTEYLMKKKEKQPIEYPSAGCVFKNWLPPADTDLELLHRRFDLNSDEEIPFTPTGAIPAGWIIERQGLKGYKVGHAMVSEKHANFLVSDGQAEATDIIGLISAVKMKVRNSTNGMVQLVEEIEFVGF